MPANADRIARRAPRSLVLREERTYHDQPIGKKRLSPDALEKKLQGEMDRLANSDQPMTQQEAEQMDRYMRKHENRLNRLP